MAPDDPFDSFQEEEHPETLRKKWEKEDFEEEFSGKRYLPCPHCGKPIEKKSFSCLYCGERVFTDSGPLGILARWILKGKWWIFAFLLMLAFFLIRLL